MAEIDARIPLMAQQAKIPDLTEMYGNAANMANLMQQTQLNRLNYQGTLALNQALQDSSNVDPNTGAPDVQKVLSGVASQGYGASPAVLAYGKNATDIAKTRADTGLALGQTQKALADAHVGRIDAQSKLLAVEGQLLSGVTDQASYDKVLSIAKNADPNGFSDAPQQYDPAYVQKRMQQAVSVKDQIDQQREAYIAQSGRMEAQASQGQAGAALQNAATNQGRLGLDTSQFLNQTKETPFGPRIINPVAGTATAPIQPGQNGQPGTPLSWTPTQMKAMEGAGANYAAMLKDYQDQSIQTSTDLQQLKQLSTLSDKADLGVGANKISALRNLAGTYLGDADTSKMTANAQIDQIANRLILNARNNPDTRVTGAFTQAQQRLEAASQLERSDPRAAFEAKVQALTDLRQRENQISSSAVQYADKHGSLDNTFFIQAQNEANQPLYKDQRPPLSSFHTGGQ